jgi:hypothetical protein
MSEPAAATKEERERERGTYCTHSTAGGELDEGEKTPR